MAVSVREAAGKKRAVAAVSLADFIGEEVRLSQEQGVFTHPRGWNEIPALVCADAAPLWHAAATRCDVFGGVLLSDPASAGDPDKWAVGWVMDGSDDRGRLCAMDAGAGLNAQIEYLQSKCNVPLQEGTVLGDEVGMTGDGKGMRVANHLLDGKC